MKKVEHFINEVAKAPNWLMILIENVAASITSSSHAPAEWNIIGNTERFFGLSKGEFMVGGKAMT